MQSKLFKKIIIFTCALLALASFLSCAPEAPPAPFIPPQDIFDYEVYFLDNFDGDQLDENKWMYTIGVGETPSTIGWGNKEKQFYRKENVEVSGGKLKIHARHETFGEGVREMPWTSGRILTRDNFYRLYGRFEARIKLPVGQGFWPAFWMKPQSATYGGWAARGEIDIMEARGRQDDRMTAALHYGGVSPQNDHKNNGGYIFPDGGSINDFHIYAVEWEEHEIRWYVDDVLHFKMVSKKLEREGSSETSWWTSAAPDSDTAPFDVPFYMLLNLAVGGEYDGNVVPETVGITYGAMEVDYVMVRSLEQYLHVPKAYKPNYPPAPSGKTAQKIEAAFTAAGYTVSRSTQIGAAIEASAITAEKGADRIVAVQFLTKETADLARSDIRVGAQSAGQTLLQDGEILYYGTEAAVAVYSSI